MTPERPAISGSSLEVVIAAFTGLGYALSARALLLLSLLGAFVLARTAMENQTAPSLAVLVAYCVFTVVPFTWLEVRRRSA